MGPEHQVLLMWTWNLTMPLKKSLGFSEAIVDSIYTIYIVFRIVLLNR